MVVPTHFQGYPRIVLTTRKEARLGNRTASKGAGRMGAETTRTCFINKQLGLERIAETKFTELNDAM